MAQAKEVYYSTALRGYRRNQMTDKVDNIVDELMSNANTGEHDIDDFMNDEDKIEAFGEIYASIANYKYDGALTSAENKAEMLSEVMNSLEGFIKHAVSRKVGA